jgi:hypothetical protein
MFVFKNIVKDRTLGQTFALYLATIAYDNPYIPSTTRIFVHTLIYNIYIYIYIYIYRRAEGALWDHSFV